MTDDDRALDFVASPQLDLSAFAGSLLGLIEDAAAIVDAHGVLLAWNRAGHRIFGYSPAEAVGMPLGEVLGGGEAAAQVAGLLVEVDAAGRVDRVPSIGHTRRGGFPLSTSMSLSRLPAGARLVMVHNHSERDEAQAELLENRRRLSDLQDLGSVGLWWWDAASGRLEWTEQLHRIHGTEPTRFEGTLEGWLALVAPDDRDRVESAVRRAGEARERFDAEYAVVRPDGQERWLHSRGEPSAAQSTVMTGMSQDITERRRTMLVLQRANERLEALGAVLAHDLKSPLATIKGFSDLVGFIETTPEQALHYLTRVGDNASKALDLVDSILAATHSRAYHLELREVPLDRVVDWVLSFLSDRLQQAGAEVEVARPLPVVYSSEEVLRQVILNLMDNAIRYRREDVPLRLAIQAGAVEGGWRLTVRDNGRGIPVAEREEVFGLGFRGQASEQVDGSGLGLATCASALADLDGTIWVEDGIDGGSALVFTIPDARGTIGAP